MLPEGLLSFEFILLQLISHGCLEKHLKKPVLRLYKTCHKNLSWHSEGKTHSLFSPHIEAWSSSFYIKLLKEAETLCVPTSREWIGVKVWETHWSTPGQNTAAIKSCSKIIYLQYYLIHSTTLYCWPSLCTAVLSWECLEFNCYFPLTLHFQTCCFKPLSWATAHFDLYSLQA